MCVEESVHIVFDEESAMPNHDLQDDEELSRTSSEIAPEQVKEKGDLLQKMPLLTQMKIQETQSKWVKEKPEKMVTRNTMSLK
ncbi:hypothetical protein KY289_008121 [Solanum tuberosum]|nr:hypothetical protein KY289_008121 [Solanum tuberosum]